ncbi:MAG: helix-turn-helix domain-containing protein [Arenicellales bacterium]|nr:helix-turn-helix domain-containing protein [Arenicellales bacterium]
MKLDFEQAAVLMAQLGNETRLKIVRLLVEAGVIGLPVGEIQRRLDIPASTLSHHISHLKHVGLVSQTRQSTTLSCCVEFSKIDAIVRFLTDECCVRGRGKTKKRKAA